MKFIIAASLIAVLLMVCEPIQSAKICVSQVNTCNDNVPVCGRFGGSNLCKKFKNRCEFEVLNCASTTPYTIVNPAMCNGIAVNTRTTCNGITTGPVFGGKFPIWNKPGLGGCKGKLCGTVGSQTQQVQPIIISGGK